MLREESFGLTQGVEVVPPKARTGGDAGLKELRPPHERMDGEEPTQGMANDDAERLRGIALFHLGREFRFDEVEELVGAAAGGIALDGTVVILDVRASGREVAHAIGVGNADDDKRRHKVGIVEEVDGGADLVDVAAGVGEICDPIAFFLSLGGRGHPHPDGAVLIQDLGVDDQLLRNGRSQFLGRK